MHSHQKVAQAFSASTEVMKLMNEQAKQMGIQENMKEYLKQQMIMERNQDMMNDAMSFDAPEVDAEADEVYNQICAEMALE